MDGKRNRPNRGKHKKMAHITQESTLKCDILSVSDNISLFISEEITFFWLCVQTKSRMSYLKQTYSTPFVVWSIALRFKLT